LSGSSFSNPDISGSNSSNISRTLQLFASTRCSVQLCSEIADRLEGRSRQQIEVADFTADLRHRSDAELQFYLHNNRWPSDEEKALLAAPLSAPTA